MSSHYFDNEDSLLHHGVPLEQLQADMKTCFEMVHGNLDTLAQLLNINPELVVAHLEKLKPHVNTFCRLTAVPPSARGKEESKLESWQLAVSTPGEVLDYLNVSPVEHMLGEMEPLIHALVVFEPGTRCNHAYARLTAAGIFNGPDFYSDVDNQKIDWLWKRMSAACYIDKTISHRKKDRAYATYTLHSLNAGEDAIGALEDNDDLVKELCAEHDIPELSYLRSDNQSGTFFNTGWLCELLAERSACEEAANYRHSSSVVTAEGGRHPAIVVTAAGAMIMNAMLHKYGIGIRIHPECALNHPTLVELSPEQREEFGIYAKPPEPLRPTTKKPGTFYIESTASIGHH